MNTFTIVTVIIGMVIASIGSWAAVRANRLTKAAPVDQRQAQLREQLKQRVRAQNRLAQAVTNLDRDLPSSIVNDDLSELRAYLNGVKHQLSAPRPEQLDVVIKSIGKALEALDVAQHPPKNDTAFLDDVQEIKANVLRPALQKALDNVNVLLHGLTDIERKPLSQKQQVKLFKELDPSTQ